MNHLTQIWDGIKKGVDYSTDTFKVIPVPKVNHYYELSKYLDMELAKEDEINRRK